MGKRKTKAIAAVMMTAALMGAMSVTAFASGWQQAVNHKFTKQTDASAGASIFCSLFYFTAPIPPGNEPPRPLHYARPQISQPALHHLLRFPLLRRCLQPEAWKYHFRYPQ